MTSLTSIYVWKCAECARTETQTWDVQVGNPAPRPVPPRGWKQDGDRLLCERHARPEGGWCIIHGTNERRDVDPVIIPDRRLCCPGCHWAKRREPPKEVA